MHTKNRPRAYTGVTCLRASESDSQAISGRLMPASGRTSPRRYQRGWSKLMMKVTRYSASGNTHSKGAEEMFCVRCEVTPSSMAEPTADSRVQVRGPPAVCGSAWADVCAAAGAAPSAEAEPDAGGEAPAAAGEVLKRQVRQASAAHSSANTTNSADQAQLTWRLPIMGSIRKGKPSSASKDAKFDSANSR